MIYLEKAVKEDAKKIVESRRLAYTDEDIRFGEGRGTYLEYIGDTNFVFWCLDRFQLYKILLDGEIIGSFWLDHETDDRQDHFELQDLCIIPQYHNRGYGRRSIELMEQLHPATKIWTLQTSCMSIRNQHLYEKMGYKRIGEKDGNILYEKVL